jgi:hypothetical protein
MFNIVATLGEVLIETLSEREGEIERCIKCKRWVDVKITVNGLKRKINVRKMTLIAYGSVQ